MATIANLDINMGARIERLSRGLKQGYGEVSTFADQATAKLNRFGAKAQKALSLGGAGRIVGGLASIAAGYAGVTKSIDSFNKALERSDELAKTSDKLGIATDQLQRLRHAAITSSEVSEGQFSTALQRMTRRISQAAQGGGEAVKVLDEMGLSAQQLALLPVDQQFLRVSDAMVKVKNQGDRVRLTFGLFDSEGVNLVNTLRMGSEAIKEAGSDIDRFGLALTRVDTSKVEAANDSFTRLQAVTDSLWDRIATEGAPTITALIEKLLDAGDAGENFGDRVSTSMDQVNITLGLIGDGLNTVTGLFKAGQFQVVDELAAGLETAAKFEKLNRRFGGEWFNFGIGEAFDEFDKGSKRLWNDSTTAVNAGLDGEFSQDLADRIEAAKNRAEQAAKAAEDIRNKLKVGDAGPVNAVDAAAKADVATSLISKLQTRLDRVDWFGGAEASLTSMLKRATGANLFEALGASAMNVVGQIQARSEQGMDWDSFASQSGPEGYDRGSAGAISSINAYRRFQFAEEQKSKKDVDEKRAQQAQIQMADFLRQALDYLRSIDKKSTREVLVI